MGCMVGVMTVIRELLGGGGRGGGHEIMIYDTPKQLPSKPVSIIPADCLTLTLGISLGHKASTTHI